MSTYVKFMPQNVLYATKKKAHLAVSLVSWCARDDESGHWIATVPLP